MLIKAGFSTPTLHVSSNLILSTAILVWGSGISVVIEWYADVTYFNQSIKALNLTYMPVSTIRILAYREDRTDSKITRFSSLWAVSPQS
jgi:hypothetical protein